MESAPSAPEAAQGASRDIGRLLDTGSQHFVGRPVELAPALRPLDHIVRTLYGQAPGLNYRSSRDPERADEWDSDMASEDEDPEDENPWADLS